MGVKRKIFPLRQAADLARAFSLAPSGKAGDFIGKKLLFSRC